MQSKNKIYETPAAWTNIVTSWQVAWWPQVQFRCAEIGMQTNQAVESAL